MLTDEQIAVVKNDILNTRAQVVWQPGFQLTVRIGTEWLTVNEPTLAQMLYHGQDQAVADFYNTPLSPPAWIWMPDVPIDALKHGIVMSEFLALSQAQRDAWRTYESMSTLDMTLPMIRANIEAIFGKDSKTAANIHAASQRPATALEALFLDQEVSALYGVRLTARDVGAMR